MGSRARPTAKGSTRFYTRRINELLDQLDTKLQEVQELKSRNAALQVKESVLHRSITEQGDNLHFIALCALGVEGEGDVALQVATCLMQDLEAFQLLKSAGGNPGVEQQEELYTTQCLRAAVTPERVQELRKSSAADRCRMTRDLVMRLGYLMWRRSHSTAQFPHSTAPAAAVAAGTSSSSAAAAAAAGSAQSCQLRSELDDVVDEYVQLLMLMSVASFVSAQRLCYVNLETEQPQTPPAGHWQALVQQLDLRPEQLQQLSICFELYTSICTPLLDQVHELTHEMQQLMNYPDFLSDLQAAAAAAPPPPPAAAPAAAAPAPSTPAPASPAPAAPARPLSTGGMLHISTSNGGTGSDHSTLMAARSDSATHSINSYCSSAGASSGLGGGDILPDTVPAPAGGGARASSSVKPWHRFGLAADGSLDLESTERLEQLLLKLEPCLDKVAQRSRILTFQVLNILDKLQIAKSAVHAFPFIVNVVQICRAAAWLELQPP